MANSRTRVPRASAAVASEYEDDDWGKPTENDGPFEHVLPSGKKILVRRLDMADILKLGLLEDLDFMSKALFADDKKKPVEGGDDEDGDSFVKAILKAGNFEKIEKTINLMVQAGVIAPKLHLPPPLNAKGEEPPRQKGLRYVDKVSFADRMEIFGIVFDSEGLSTFRNESTTGVADVPDVTDVPLPPE